MLTFSLDLVEFESVPSKRQSLIPFPRVGKRGGSVFNRRILRSNNWRPIRSNDFKRRITRSYWDKSALRGEGFKRRITRSAHGPQRLMKRQSLIPFPRTGKRSDSLANKEQNQIYMFDNDDEEDGAEENFDYYDEDLGRTLIVANSTLELSVHKLSLWNEAQLKCTKLGTKFFAHMSVCVQRMIFYFLKLHELFETEW